METDKTTLNVPEDRVILDVVDELAQVPGLKDHINVPRVFVGGSNNAEEARFLEAFIGFCIEDIVGADLPTPVILRCSDQEEPHVFLEPLAGRTGDVGETGGSEDFEQNGPLTTESAVSLDLSVDRVPAPPETLLGFKLTSPDVPDISFVYVPGLGSPSSVGQWPLLLGDARTTLRCVLVLVLSLSTRDLAAIPAVQLAQRYDSTGCRTLLVLTRTTAGQDAEELGATQSDDSKTIAAAEWAWGSLPRTGWRPQFYIEGAGKDPDASSSMRTDVVAWMTRQLRDQFKTFAGCVEQEALQSQRLLDHIRGTARHTVARLTQKSPELRQLRQQTSLCCQNLRRALHDNLERALEAEIVDSTRPGSARPSSEVAATATDLVRDVMVPAWNWPGEGVEFPPTCQAMTEAAVDDFLGHTWKMVQERVGDILDNHRREPRERSMDETVRRIESGFRWMAREIMSAFKAASLMPGNLHFAQRERQWKDGQFRQMMRASLDQERDRSISDRVDVEKWFTRHVTCPILEMDVMTRRKIYCQVRRVLKRLAFRGRIWSA